MWVFFDVDAPGSRQAQLRAGVLDGLGDEDVALPDGVVVRRRAARIGQFDVDDDNRRRIIACFLDLRNFSQERAATTEPLHFASRGFLSRPRPLYSSPCGRGVSQ